MPEQEAQKIVQQVIILLKHQRKIAGRSQRSVAAQAGVDPKTVSLIERGIRSPTLFTLSLLASALNVPLSKILHQAEASLSSQ
jgi:transcriptional regulator with XRE-family HTH domain